jgi:hypothetical protein
MIIKPLIAALKKDGFAPDGNFDLKWKDGKLTINGKEQPADVVKKYRPYFDGEKEFSILR